MIKKRTLEDLLGSQTWFIMTLHQPPTCPMAHGEWHELKSFNFVSGTSSLCVIFAWSMQLNAFFAFVCIGFQHCDPYTMSIETHMYLHGLASVCVCVCRTLWHMETEKWIASMTGLLGSSAHLSSCTCYHDNMEWALCRLQDSFFHFIAVSIHWVRWKCLL